MSLSRKMRRQAERAQRRATLRAHADAPVTLPPFPEGPGLTFDEAVAAITAAAPEARRCYWTFEPITYRQSVTGGTLSVLAWEDADSDDELAVAEVRLWTTSNEFNSGMGEADDVSFDEVPDEVRALRFHPGPPTVPPSMSDSDVMLPLFAMLGRSEDEALALLESLPGPH